VVGKNPVEFEKYLEKKIAVPEEDISTLILFNTQQPSYPQCLCGGSPDFYLFPYLDY
jgi:hypothetical protein